MSRLKLCGVKYKNFAQTNIITKTGINPVSIIGSGIGSMSVNANKLKIGSVLSLTQTGKITSGVGTQSTVKFKVNETITDFGTGTLANNLSDAGLKAEWAFTVKSIDAENITFQVAARSAINAVTFQSNYSRVKCIEVVIPISTAYAFDILYNFDDNDGSISIGQTIFEVTY